MLVSKEYLAYRMGNFSGQCVRNAVNCAGEGPVAQRQSSGLIIHWSLVRIQPGPVVFYPQKRRFRHETAVFSCLVFPSIFAIRCK